MAYKLPIVLTPQPEGGFTVTSPVLPELMTEGDTMAEVLEHLPDAIQAVLEIYEDEGKPLPFDLIQEKTPRPIYFEYLMAG